MNIRRAKREDVDAIIHFQVSMARETEGLELDEKVLRKGVEALFTDESRGGYFVAELANQVVGSLMLTFEWSDWRNSMVWWIQSVYVSPEFRKRGVYGGLYRHVKALAEADPGIAGIRLYVDRRNTLAQEVYQRLGMNGEHYQVFEWMKG